MTEPGSGPAEAKPWYSRVDPDLLELLPGLLDNLRDDTEQLAQLAVAEDYLALARLGHNYKGSAVYFGVEELGRLARSLEISAKNRDRASIASVINDWQTLVKELRLPDEP